MTIGARKASLELRPLDGRSWRLCDASVRARDAACLVAYVEQTRRGYEVVWLQHPCPSTTFRSLREVLDLAERRFAQR